VTTRRTLLWLSIVLGEQEDAIMNVSAQAQTSLLTIGIIFAAMATLAIVEAVVPLQPRGRWGRAHLGANFALTTITVVSNLVLNVALTLALISLDSIGFGLRHWLPIGSIGEIVVVVVALDLSFYVAHVAMHNNALFWRFHRVHHADPFVDVTTTIRQHPGEGLIRYAFLAAAATLMGVSPVGFAVYRLWSVLNALLEHSNIRVPARIDTIASIVITTPNMHKVHHSRNWRETDSNYGNIFSVFDRLFSTFTPSRRGMDIHYGLDGLDEPGVQTTAGLLAMPFVNRTASSGDVDWPANAGG
jgi:sterol desaturase/sphingolipid hydroxylase (fatty acid hydroxylase superfamily)